MSDNAKKYLVDLCHYIDCMFTLAFMVLFIRLLWYAGDGCEYALVAFIGVLVWPAKEHWAEWIGLENSHVQSRNY